MEKKEMHKLLIELENYENSGVTIWLDNVRSTPGDVVKACYVREESGSYMRDYVSDEEGGIRELRFDSVINR